MCSVGVFCFGGTLTMLNYNWKHKASLRDMGSKGDQQSWSEIPEGVGTLGNENRYETLHLVQETPILKSDKKLKKKETFQKDSKEGKQHIFGVKNV